MIPWNPVTEFCMLECDIAEYKESGNLKFFCTIAWGYGTEEKRFSRREVRSSEKDSLRSDDFPKEFKYLCAKKNISDSMHAISWKP